ncbi:hypothetical protein M011DRAFT_472926 [Sporormia fimetaria CBS 119925]|uniref:Uncharacterized protein n=1 Tax=Sporormia fimetaria CBS 119925 TaxID=1340428 RepID=A0A6A6UXA7_9PLEO|nr:hypothetical protein M011DRAFT_472926 [Sporormia fimetaria CBS 119925]
MSSSSASRRLRLVEEIIRYHTPADIPCDRCFESGRPCLIMPNSSLKCAECTRLGRPCVNLSWGALDRTREEYQKKVDADEKLLAEVIARLLRNKKILKQAEERARKKVLCLASELRESGEDVDAQFTAPPLDCPAASIGIAFSPAMWETMGLLDSYVATEGTAPAFGDNS